MAYASASDIETRLKPRLGRSFNDDEKAAAEMLCEGAAAVIDECTKKPVSGDDVPPVMRFVSIELVRRAMSNPSGLVSEQEGLGAYSHAERYMTDGNLELKETEEAMVRRAVHGKLSGSSEPESLISDEVARGEIAPASYPLVEPGNEGS